MSKTKKQALISTERLSIGYPNRTVARDISIEISPGELTAIIGVNGSGKSTLLKTLTGELPKIAGRVSLLDKPLTDFSPKVISEYISIVLPNPKVTQNLNVFEVVAIGRHPYTNWLGRLTQKDRTAVTRALNHVGIDHLAQRNCHELSDGQLQKVFIARALAQDTEIIFLDEPTNHLDIYYKAFVFKLLKRLSRKMDKAIVLASHEINLVLELCDMLIVFDADNVEQGTPENLFQTGGLKRLFPQGLIEFDSKSRRFRLARDQ